MNNKFHHFHMVTMSPWPLTTSFQILNSVLMMSSGLVSMFKMKMMLMPLMTTSLTSAVWWKNTILEASQEGIHQKSVITGLKMGMILFILSEVMFFSSFFWGYFHMAISPNLEMGQMWPPMSIKSFDPTNVPLLNTMILISSGVSVTWAHHELLLSNQKKTYVGLMVTCLLGVYFTILQYLEYSQGEFSMSDSSYGSIFFMATGFHGIHVIVGTTFLLTSMMLVKKMKMSSGHHISFEMSAWYWHFVDVVWLFLYLSIYWWGK